MQVKGRTLVTLSFGGTGLTEHIWPSSNLLIWTAFWTDPSKGKRKNKFLHIQGSHIQKDLRTFDDAWQFFTSIHTQRVCGWLWRLDGAATEKRGSSMRPGVTVCRQMGVVGTEGARAEQQSGWKEAMCTSCTYRKYLHRNAVYRSQMAAEWKLLIIACFEKVLFKKEGKINDRDSSQQHIKRLRGLPESLFLGICFDSLHL